MQHHRFKVYNYVVALFLSATAIVSCKDNAIKTVMLDDENKPPSVEMVNLDVAYTEAGRTKMLLQAPLLQRFLFVDDPYSVFPHGFHVQFFSDSEELESQITADYALYKEKPVELWLATGNVMVINFLKNQRLYTDTLYWNRVEQSIFTNAPVRIITEDGIINGRDGMTSDERFTNYEIRRVGESRYYFDDTPDQPADTISTVIPETLVQ